MFEVFLKGFIMDFGKDNDRSDSMPPSGPISGMDMSRPAGYQRRGRSGWRIFWGIVIVMSVIANVILFLVLIGVISIFVAGQGGILTEEVVREGPAKNKVAIISVQGVINKELAGDVKAQLKAARHDSRVKGLIIRVNSPGGTISASDDIYQEIRKFRDEEKKPVLAFMQGVAASGGYYTSVACEKIIAEPTTITGSIGVISLYFVVQELLENKLGVLPVTVKSGQKKDWPSSFRPPSPEELQYMRDKLINPAYERFIEVVAEGRKSLLTSDNVRKLADGSIFYAQEALEEKLIDDIGYLDEAIEKIQSLAGIGKAQVVEYRRPFSLSDFLSYRKSNLLKIDKTTLYELSTPHILYLWSAY
jgi:protease-4